MEYVNFQLVDIVGITFDQYCGDHIRHVSASCRFKNDPHKWRFDEYGQDEDRITYCYFWKEIDLGNGARVFLGSKTPIKGWNKPERLGMYECCMPLGLGETCDCQKW